MLGLSTGGWTVYWCALGIFLTSVAAGTQVRAQDLRGLNDRIEQLSNAGRYSEAIPLAERALELTRARRGESHIETATRMGWLADLHKDQGNYAQAEPLYLRALAIRVSRLGAGHPTVALSLNNLAGMYEEEGRYDEAEPMYERALAIVEKELGPSHANVGTALNNLGQLYHSQGRFSDAESLYVRALATREKALGREHQDVGESVNNLAELYRDLHRYGEAEALFKRSLTIYGNALGSGHPNFATALNNLALLYSEWGRFAEAERHYQHALVIREKMLGVDHPFTNLSRGNLAALYGKLGRYADAEALLIRARTSLEQSLGPDHPYVARSFNNLAAIYVEQGRYADAQALFKHSLAISEKVLGREHPDIITSLGNLAGLYFEQRDWSQAADFLRRSTDIIIQRARRGAVAAGSAGQVQTSTGKGSSETERAKGHFWGLVAATFHLADGGRDARRSLAAETFQTVQWSQSSEAAASLAQMAVRGARGDPALAVRVRERQDLVAEWQKRDGARTAAVAQPPDRRNANAETANSARLAAIDTRVADIDRRFRVDFPDYVALTSPSPLSVDEVQAQIAPDEALILFLDTPEWKSAPEATFLWVVTKADVRWVRSSVGTPSLAREVAALRCGLDYDGAWGVAGSRCAELLGVVYTAADRAAGKPLPFEVARAHALYKALFGQIEDLVGGKHLFVVPSGPLTQLPLHVLVTAEPRKSTAGIADHRQIAWLARSNTITVLPAVASLQALRQHAKASQAAKPLLGFGNPLLDGPDSSYANLKQAALKKQSCGGPVTADVAERRGGAGVRPFPHRGGIVSAADLRRAPPLPETADELCDVAKATGASEADIFLGARANESEIKRLSVGGGLRDYRVLHFATHGALAGEVSGATEPGLLLTPPQIGTEDDDGYLSASEIAALKLDADWIILSACNTAAGEATGAEALSGLARAFFYAGARALLVSHWYVDSNATAVLIKGAFAELKVDPKLGRAEALRRSMLALINNGSDAQAHPSAWAPFVLVGEGGAGR